MKKILKWTGITVGGLFLLLLISPILFKGKIEQAIKDAVNENVNANINWNDVSLSLIRNFPNARVTIEGLNVMNTQAPFDSVQMATIGEFTLVIDIKSLFGESIDVKRIAIQDANLDIRVMPDGTANYDIAKVDTTAVETPKPDESQSAGFHLRLKEYALENINLQYDDQSMPMKMIFEGLNHRGSGDFTQDVFKLITETDAKSTTFWFDGTTYLNKVKTLLKADLEMDMVNSKYTLAGNTIQLNELELESKGWVAMPGEDIDMDISFKALKNEFRQFLSMVPLEFAKDISGVNAAGSLALDGYVRGRFNDNSMPSIGLNIAIENGQFKYPDLPKSVDNIQLKAAIAADMNVMDRTTIDVDLFHLEMAGNPVDMSLKLRTPESDPFVDFMMKANIDLDKVKEFIPLEKTDEVHGLITTDIAVKGNYKAAEEGRYDAFDAHGLIDITNVLFRSDSLPYDLQIDAAQFELTPAYAAMNKFDARIGKSDLHADGKILNYVSYALFDSSLTGIFNLRSDLLNLNEFMSTETSEATETTAASSDTAAMTPIALPAHVDFTMSSQIKKLMYDKTQIDDINGKIVLRNATAKLDNLGLTVLQGRVIMNGTYYAQDITRPSMDFSFDIAGMDIHQAGTEFNTIEKFAPVTKACNGKFNARFAMSCALGQDMMPVMKTVDGKGQFQTIGVVIKDFAPVMKLADKINLDKLKQPLNVSNTNITFAITDGMIKVEPFTVSLIEGVPMKVEGYTTLEQDINYSVEMDVPLDKFPAGIMNQAGSFLGQLNQKMGTNINLGNKINVIALITGKVTDPQIKVTSKALGEDAVNEIREQVVEEVKEQLTNLKNEALEKAKLEKERLVNEAKAQRDKLISEAAKQRDNAKVQGETAARRAKEEAIKKADELVSKTKNPLEKAGAKLAAETAKKEADKTYGKAVEKSNQEADKAYNSAVERANKMVVDAEARGDKMIQDADAQGSQQINKVK